MGTFQDKTSMDRILFAVFNHENKSQGVSTPAEKLHVDDTPVPVLAPGTGTTKTGRLWVYLRDERALAGGGRRR
jgi:Transposase IS66 family